MAIGLIFRLFISSTFSDFTAERESLQNEVFPQLADYCQKHGATFQAVDLRWGITEEAQREHDTMRICLEEVRRCQQLSPRPNFAVLLGDRYGWEPVPARIPQDHWQRLMVKASLADRVLIEKSYKLDLNAIPPVYCLPQRRLERGSGWEDHEAKLLQALRRAASGFRGRARLPYFASATHQEIVLGALISKKEREGKLLPNEHVHVYVRNLEGLPQDDTAKDFIDWDASTQQIALGARDRLRGLEAKLRRKLGDHVHDLHTHWRQHGHNGAVDEAYLKRFCESFLVHQKAVIDAELASGLIADDRQLREEAHRDFGAERARVFADRQTLLKKIAKYTELVGEPVPKDCQSSELIAPLILLGAGGSGKSALLAKAAQLHRKRAKGTGVIILERYIGGVPGTESLMNTLTALTADIANFYDQPEPPVPENAKGLAESFLNVLGNASEKRPLQIYLDALDQLDSADSAWMLEWLPKKLLPHVSMVVSARTGTNVEQYARSRDPKSLIEIPPMKPTEGREMLKLWLADKRSAWFNAGIVPTRGRRLTAIQQESLLRAFNHNGSALWLKLAYEEASSWQSWDAPRDLPADIQGLIEDLIDQRLLKKENHPRVLTERALAYLTAGRFGLSETELGRALGTDAAVRAEFVALEKTQHKWNDSRQLPPILWSRLFFDLQPYLGLAMVDGVLVMRWFHREFKEVLQARYLASYMDRREIHGALSYAFFQLERELRPEETNDDALFKATDAGGNQVSAALRRVMEQPWHLAQSERQRDLQILLTDFGFCMGKCAANRSNDLTLDFIAAQFDQSHSTAIVSFYISVGHILRRGTNAWPSHRILLQRASESALDQASAARQWLERGLCDWDWLRLSPLARANPDSSCQSATEVIFEGHEGTVHGAHFLLNGQLLSWSIDGSLKLWDTISGQCLHSMPFDDGNAWNVVVHDNALAIVCYNDSPVCVVWNVQTGEKVAELIGHEKAVTGCAWLAQGHALTWSKDGTLRVWHAATFKEERRFDRHTKSIAGACVLHDGRVASWTKGGELWIWNPVGPVTFSESATMVGTSVLGALLPADGRLLYWTVSGSFFRADQGLQEFKHVFDAGLEIVTAGVPTHALEVASGQIAYWHELIVHHGTHEHVIEVWDLDRRELRGRLAGHLSTIEGVKVAPGNRLISYDNNGETRLWNLEYCSELGTFRGPSQVWGVCPVGESRILASGDDIRIWDIESSQPIATWNDFSSARDCISAPRNRILIMHFDGSMRLVNVGGRFVQPIDKSNSDPVTATCVVRDCIIAGYQDGNLALFDSAEGRQVGIISVHEGQVKRIAPGIGDFAVSIGEDGVVGFIDLNARICRWKHATGRHVFGAWQTCGRTVLVGLIGHGFLILDAESGKELKSILDAESRTSGLREGRSTGLEIFNFKKIPAEVWDCSRVRKLYALDGHDDAIFHAELISQSHLVTASKDKTLRVWSHPEGVCQHVMHGHSDWVTHFDVIDARRIVSFAGNYEGKPIDTRLLVWDITEGKCIDVLAKHTESIAGTLLVESGKLISWSSNGEVNLWCLESLKPIGFWQWNWGDIKSMSELESGVILVKNRIGRGFVWSLDRDSVEKIDLRNIIEDAPHWFKPFLGAGLIKGLSSADFEGQWIGRRLVVLHHGGSAPIYWDDDHIGELLSASRQGIIGVKAGRRVKFLELVHA
jgi:WD40 repeat protein